MRKRPRTNDRHICIGVSHWINLVETAIVPIERDILAVSKCRKCISCPVQNAILIYRIVFVPLLSGFVVAPSLVRRGKVELIKRVAGYLISRSYCVINTSVLPKFVFNGVV